MLMTVTFENENGKTKLTMQQTIPTDLAERNGAREGWTQSFDKLAAALSP
jgi:uncharacterized protein YndB with AHSA1/START domain